MVALIVIGIFLIILGIIVLMPFFGTGAFTAGFGDIVIDIPLSIVLILIGSVMLIIGGAGLFISQFWWLIPVGLIVWLIVLWAKVKFSKTRRR